MPGSCGQPCASEHACVRVHLLYVGEACGGSSPRAAGACAVWERRLTAHKSSSSSSSRTLPHSCTHPLDGLCIWFGRQGSGMQLSAAVQLRRQELAVWVACQGVAVCSLRSDNVLLQARPLKMHAVPSRVD